jgi:cytochrome b
VQCHNPAGAIVSLAALVALGVGGGILFTDPPAVRTLRSTYFYHLMEKRMK